jgi:valyl-tRNA synthetase
MIMMGLKFMGDVPFRQVHINGIVRDASRKKMSKTRGNVIEPLRLVEQYGADAVRFTLSSMAVPGTDIPFSEDRMKGYRAFANKVWQASNFVLMNLKENGQAVPPDSIDALLAKGKEDGLSRSSLGAPPPPGGERLALEDRWILHRLNRVAAELAEALEKFRFHDASNLVYHFIWHEFCDWYIELVKPALTGASSPERESRIKVLVHVMDYSLRLLHPFMPFITEEIWQRIPHQGDSIMMQDFPMHRDVREDPEAELKMETLMDLVNSIRSARSEMGIEDRKAVDAFVLAADAGVRELIERNGANIRHLASLGKLEFVSAFPPNLLRGVSKAGEFGINLMGSLDFEAERSRMQKELTRTRGEIDKIDQKMSNHDFMSKAPEQVISGIRERHAELVEKYAKLESNLARLSSQ